MVLSRNLSPFVVFDRHVLSLPRYAISMDPVRQLSNAKKRRGVARATLTRLSTRLKDLEGENESTKTLELAKRMSQKLTDLDSEFRTHHHNVVDLIDDDDTLAKEQETLDSHDDLVAELSVQVKQVIAASSPSSNESSRRIANRKLTQLQKSLASITSAISDFSTDPSDVCLLKQYEERTNDLNKDLARVRDDLHRIELDEADKLFELQDTLEGQVFDCSVQIKKLLSPACAQSELSTLPSESKGVRLPKLYIPTFGGNIKLDIILGTVSYFCA